MNHEPFVLDGDTFAVFDPLGGTAGERAVTIAREAFCAAVRRERGDLRGALTAANAAIHVAIGADRTLHGAGCTVAALALSPSTATVAWTGDVHVLRIRADQITALTLEHSLANDCAEDVAAKKGDESMAVVPHGVIVEALGMRATMVIDCITASMAAGDVFVLLSSGLREALGDGVLVSTLLAHGPDARTVARALLEEGSVSGGRDSLTVVVVVTGKDGEQIPAAAFYPR